MTFRSKIHQICFWSHITSSIISWPLRGVKRLIYHKKQPQKVPVRTVYCWHTSLVVSNLRHGKENWRHVCVCVCCQDLCTCIGFSDSFYRMSLKNFVGFLKILYRVAVPNWWESCIPRIDTTEIEHFSTTQGNDPIIIISIKKRYQSAANVVCFNSDFFDSTSVMVVCCNAGIWWFSDTHECFCFVRTQTKIDGGALVFEVFWNGNSQTTATCRLLPITLMSGWGAIEAEKLWPKDYGL